MSAALRSVSVLAGTAVVLYAVFVIYLVAGPLHSDDLWFHLTLGRHFVAHGLWSGFDPALHTAHAASPVLHEWLFDVAIHGLETQLGFAGLRVLLAGGVAIILGLAWSTLRRESAGPMAAYAAMAVFLSLSWWRLHELRPHLVSIAFTLLFVRLLVQPESPPSWRRVWIGAVLGGVWANLHPGFILGPVLLLGAAIGCAIRAALFSRLPGERAAAGSEARRGWRLGGAAALTLVATLMNPRGFHQHLTFFEFRRDTALPALDEWPGFDPLGFTDVGSSFGGFEWMVAEGLLLLTVSVAAAGLWRLLRHPSAESLRAVDPVALLLAGLSLVAMLVAMRFSWLAVLPLLFLLRAQREGARGLPWLASPRLAAGLASLAVALAVAFGALARYGQFAVVNPSSWAASSYTAAKYFAPGMQFLGETGVEGNVFNSYHAGGFLGYWLSPRLRAFIDGRNEAYPPEVHRDYERVILRRGAAGDGDLLGLLDRRRVDLFLGDGYPFGLSQGPRYYTAAHLWEAPGWILVFRSVDHAVYLRRDARNRENLERIAAWYERQAIAFHRDRGLDVEAVIAESPGWAIAHRLLPVDHRALLRASTSPVRGKRMAALARLGTSYALIGAYQSELRIEREALALRPDAIAPRARLAHALLRLGRIAAAVEEIRVLERSHPQDPAAGILARAAAGAMRARARPDAGRWPPPSARLLGGFPLLDPAAASRALAGRFAKTLGIDPSRFPPLPQSSPSADPDPAPGPSGALPRAEKVGV